MGNSRKAGRGLGATENNDESVQTSLRALMEEEEARVRAEARENKKSGASESAKP